MTKNEERRPLVCLLASAETSASVLYGLYDVLSTAGAIYGEVTKGVTGDEVLDVKIVSATQGPFRCFGGIVVEPHDIIDALDEADFIVVCDMYTPIDTPRRVIYDREIAWVKRLYAKGSMLGSVCSGSLVLAEAGLLDGEETAGHWGYRELFRTHYPKVKVRAGEILCFGGEGERIVTAGGSSSWQELALHLIARLCGAEHTIETAKVHILSGHSDGQLPVRRVHSSCPEQRYLDRRLPSLDRRELRFLPIRLPASPNALTSSPGLLHAGSELPPDISRWSTCRRSASRRRRSC